MKIVIFFVILFATSPVIAPLDFLSEQKKYAHVKAAYAEKGAFIAAKLKEENIKLDALNILFVVYKNEKQFDLYAKNKSDLKYKKISTYAICASSGQLGPKRQQGDGQVPEGFYTINVFNPTSGYYLSLGVSYPNQADRKKTTAKDPGGNIMIHGECVTIGCIPMTNDKIKEIYLYAIQAKQNGQTNIPVYIFPFKMENENMKKHKSLYANKELNDFWDNIKTGHDLFCKENKELKFTIDKNGDYNF